jgi:hypothetical protein
MEDFSHVPYVKRTRCAVCDREISSSTLSFPTYPLTEIYIAKKPQKKVGFANQYFYYCSCCGHGQLLHIIPKEILYTNTSYFLRTSQSGTSRSANDYFLSYIEKIIGKRRFGSIIEFGCSDLYLLSKLKKHTSHLVGIDPILKGTTHTKIKIIGDFIEDVDLASVWEKNSNLVLSSHTMEHIESPARTIQTLLSHATVRDLFIFQFPSLEPLVSGRNYDQIFHQHLQYFSVSSITYLIERFGGELIDFEVNYQHWGTGMIVFRKKTGKKSKRNIKIPFHSAEIQKGYIDFQNEMKQSMDYIHSLKGERIFGFGAALMLPVLGYHLGSDFSEFEYILDDDKQKEGLFYINLPVSIRTPSKSEKFGDANVVITAYNTIRSVLPRVLSLKPKRIVFTRKVI